MAYINVGIPFSDGLLISGEHAHSINKKTIKKHVKPDKGTKTQQACSVSDYNPTGVSQGSSVLYIDNLNGNIINNYRYESKKSNRNQSDRRSDRCSTNPAERNERNYQTNCNIRYPEVYDESGNGNRTTVRRTGNRYPVQMDILCDQNSPNHQPKGGNRRHIQNHESHRAPPNTVFIQNYTNYDNRIIHHYGCNPIGNTNSNGQQGRHFKNYDGNQNHHDGYHPDRNVSGTTIEQPVRQPANKAKIHPSRPSVAWTIPMGETATAQKKQKVKNQKEFEAYPAEEVTEEAARAHEPENVEPEPEVAPSEQLDEPDPHEPEEYSALSLPEDAARAHEPENVEPEPEVAPSEQLDEPDPHEPKEYSALSLPEDAARAHEPENVEPEPEVAPSEQLDEPDPHEPEEYSALSLPEDAARAHEPEVAPSEQLNEPHPHEPEEYSKAKYLPDNEYATPPIQPEKKVRKGLGKFFSDMFKTKKQEPVGKAKPDKTKPTDETLVERTTKSEKEKERKIKQTVTNQQTAQGQREPQKPKEDEKKPSENKKNWFKKKLEKAEEKIQKFGNSVKEKKDKGIKNVKNGAKKVTKFFKKNKK
jgi:hypothetical protein